MGSYRGFVGNTPMSFDGPGIPDRARADRQGIVAVRSNEGKAAKAFIDKINTLAFSEHMFAEMLLALGGQALTPRIMAIVKAIIRNLAGYYDFGHVTNETVDAKRLMDTLDHYGM